MRTILSMLLLLPIAGSGCSPAPTAEPPASRELTAETYPEAFRAAVEVLRELGFEPNRVDARAGVISTDPEQSAGLLTPWNRTESTAYQELSGAAHRHRRVVRVAFGPEADTTALPGDAGSQVSATSVPPPIGSIDGPLRLTVTAHIERIEAVGQRLDPTSVRLASVSEDRVLSERGMWPSYTVTRRRDPALEQRVAQRIADRISSSK